MQKDPNFTCHADYAMTVSLKIESDLDSKLPLLDVVNSSFPSWAASNLSVVLLPPLPPVVPPPSSRSSPRARATPQNKPAPPVKKGPKRPSLRYFEENFILLCMGREAKSVEKIISYISLLIDRIIMISVKITDDVIYMSIHQLIASKNQSKCKNDSTYNIVKHCTDMAAIFR